MINVSASWDKTVDVIVIGYSFAGAIAAITASDAGARILLIEKAPEQHKGGNSRVWANVASEKTAVFAWNPKPGSRPFRPGGHQAVC